jgi:uncharacterized membrane protein YfcA
LNNLVFSSLLALGAVAAGFLGSLTGLGGGVVLIPLLVLVFGVDIHYAMGASLVSIIATSSGSAAAYVKEGYTNIRLGMFLEIATTFGAVAGAFVAGVVPASALAVVFGVVLLVSAFLSSRPRAEEEVDKRPPDPLATRLRLDSTYPTRGGRKTYHVHNIPFGFAIMFVAGILSGLLGIGSGAFKVLAMDQAMRIPFKVSTTTSNFMIGVTAAASAGVYLRMGYIDPRLAMPVMLGVLLGAFLGTRVLVVARVPGLRIIFGVVILALGAEMIYDGIRKVL